MEEKYIISNEANGSYIHIDRVNQQITVDVKRSLDVTQQFIFKMDSEDLIGVQDKFFTIEVE